MAIVESNFLYMSNNFRLTHLRTPVWRVSWGKSHTPWAHPHYKVEVLVVLSNTSH